MSSAAARSLFGRSRVWASRCSRCSPTPQLLQLQSAWQYSVDNPESRDSADRASSASKYRTNSPLVPVKASETFVSRLLEGMHRLVTFMVSLRTASAREMYVRRYLLREAGMDSFSVEMALVKQPSLLSLSVAQQLEPVIYWLRSQGICAPELSGLLASWPDMLGARVDEQLQPLAELVASVGGDCRAVLLAYPALIAMPVGLLAAALHALQLAGASAEQARALVEMPDLWAALAAALADPATSSSSDGSGSSGMPSSSSDSSKELEDSRVWQWGSSSSSEGSAAQLGLDAERFEGLQRVRDALQTVMSELHGSVGHEAACEQLEEAIQQLRTGHGQRAGADQAAAAAAAG